MSNTPSDLPTGVEYDSESNTYRVTYSHGTTAPSTVVADAIQEIHDSTLSELDPLYTVVDPDAFDALVQPTITGGHRGDVKVQITYQDFHVTVQSYGLITIRPACGDDQSRHQNK